MYILILYYKFVDPPYEIYLPAPLTTNTTSSSSSKYVYSIYTY